MNIKTALLPITLALAGCASSPKVDYDTVNPEILAYCENVSQLYGQVHDLKELGATNTQAIAFIYKMVDDSQISPKEAEDIKGNARNAVYYVYDSPKTSKKRWISGIKEQCVKKPNIL